MLRRFFTLGFGIVGAALVLTVLLPAAIQLFFSFGPVGFVVFVLLFFFVGSIIFD